MTEMQKRMQELISKEALDRAFDARFPKEMQEKLRAAKVAVVGLGGLGSNIVGRACEKRDRETASGRF